MASELPRGHFQGNVFLTGSYQEYRWALVSGSGEYRVPAAQIIKLSAHGR